MLKIIRAMLEKWEKLYYRINWLNQPNTSTALGATNLNKMDRALNEIDDRVILLKDSKLDVDTGNMMVLDVNLDTESGILMVEKLDGTTASYDLNIEKVVVNFYLNEKNQLVLVNGDGTEQLIDLSKFIDTYTFHDTNTIAITNNNKNISAVVKRGSITADKLQPDYLADITQQALHARESSMQSESYALDAKRYAVGGVIPEDIEDNSRYYCNETKMALTDFKEGLASGEYKGEKGDQGEPGVIILVEGQYSFEVRDDCLWLIYPDNTTSPDFRISDTGDLILII